MFAEAIHVKDIEQSNLQEKIQSWPVHIKE